jgi:cytochrome c553
MKVRFLVIIGILALPSSVTVFARHQNPAGGQKTTKTMANKDAAASGEQRFLANCGRCHNPPDSLSPREVKAVLQHMRVRAMLTAEDEQLILKYLAP